MSIEVEIIKSDVRLGRTVEAVHEFHDLKDAKQFVIDFNSALDPDQVLDVYHFAQLMNRRRRTVDDGFFK